ncbi:hypothetical protein [Mucilaginibacter psychrotolerans]|uniref:Lipocalin-like domain-containing protein n=1 Tax=Mucilaginibacter psychrotolerans TaxID=1524096 RepID=A0A4Y8S777_9SPHI|nr:hypothetical protein [Mucilaginibacter psychrotolerans]TFF34317.1 hypothetical protein E2R66_22545 [Mucilaginibacter psychrotolerans]
MKTKNNYLKATALAAALILASSTISFAQCDKPIFLASSATNYYNAKGELQRTKDEETIITLTKTEVIIAPGDEAHKMTGPIKSYSCNWTMPYKEGKTVVTSTFTDGGKELNATITIEGKGGQVTVTMVAAEMPDMRIQVVADKFE